MAKLIELFNRSQDCTCIISTYRSAALPWWAVTETGLSKEDEPGQRPPGQKAPGASQRQNWESKGPTLRKPFLP